MTSLAVAVLVFAAFDPLVVALRLVGAPPRPRLVGVLAGAGGAVVLVWLARPLLDGLDVEPESFWIAAGLVLGASGLVRVVVPRGIRPHAVGEPWHWALPIAYPVVIGPELVLAAMASGAHDDGAAATMAVALAAGLVLVAPARGRPYTGALSRLLAAAQVVLAIALVIDGIRGV